MKCSTIGFISYMPRQGEVSPRGIIRKRNELYGEYKVSAVFKPKSSSHNAIDVYDPAYWSSEFLRVFASDLDTVKRKRPV